MARKQDREDAEKGITAIKVKGFKSICDEHKIEIRPLTILAGANSSGKTSFMQPLLLLKQTLEATYDPGPLLLNGPNARFSSMRDILSHVPSRPACDEFTVGFEIDGRPRSDHSFGVDGDDIRLVEKRYLSGAQQAPLVLREGMSHGDVSAMLEASLVQLPADTEKLGELTVSRDRCFMSVVLAPDLDLAVVLGSLRLDSLRAGVPPAPEPRLRDAIHVPGLRGRPERTYPTTSAGPSFPGPFQEYVATLVAHWQSERDERLDRLGEHIRLLGLAGGVGASQINGAAIELRVGRVPECAGPRAGDMVNIADAGFGISQSLPVSVALLVAEPGRVVFIEQPEVHLHPRAQTRMAEILGDAAERGLRVVVETHSALLLLGVRTLVAEGKLDPALVKLHWFTRQPDGSTTINSTDLDEEGAFGDWPEDFGAVEMAAEDRYLQAVGL